MTAITQPFVVQRLTADLVRGAWGTFRVVKRNGYDPEVVKDYLNRIAEHLAERDRHETGLKEDASRATAALKRWQSDHVNENMFASDADVDAARAEATNILVRAQNQANADIARGEAHARALVADARSRVAEMYEQAEQFTQAAQAAAPIPDPAAVDDLAETIGDKTRELAAEREQHERKVAEFVGYLDEVQDQIRAAREHLPVPATEVPTLPAPSLPDAPVLEFPDRSAEEPPDGAA